MNQKDLEKLIKMVEQLFVHWQITKGEQSALLGVSQLDEPGGTRVAKRDDFEARLCLLLSIHRSLRLLFPRNRAIVYSWVSRKNNGDLFFGRRPLDLMMESFDGLSSVARHLHEELYR